MEVDSEEDAMDFSDDQGSGSSDQDAASPQAAGKSNGACPLRNRSRAYSSLSIDCDVLMSRQFIL